jgi:pre-mRNA-processing factor 6
MKTVMLERYDGNLPTQRLILTKSLQKHPNSWKLWIILAQMEDELGNIDAARNTFVFGIFSCPNAAPLWTNYAFFEERKGKLNRARTILEQSRLKNSKNASLLRAAIQLELLAGNSKAAQSRLVSALKKCPTSGLLWSQAITIASRSERKFKCIEALKHCDNNPHVISAVAQLFWQDHKIEKARRWFTKALNLGPDFGDIWAIHYNFELKHGTLERQETLIRECKKADPHHGEIWTQISKDYKNTKMSKDIFLKKVAEKIARYM